LLASLWKADADFGLLKPPILLGFSGGKDSWALHHLLDLADIPHQLAHVVPNGGISDEEKEWIEFLQNYFSEKITIIKYDIFSLLKGNRKDCFTCSRKRRQLLLETAQEQKISNIALAHHRQDVVETFFLNVFFSRELSTMMPKQPVFAGHFNWVRPLYYIDEADIERLQKEKKFRIKTFSCPVEISVSRRQWIKKKLAELQQENSGIDILENAFAALFQCNHRFLPKIEKENS